MKKVLKKFVTALSLASVLFVAMPKQKANAGILLSPAYGTGLVLVILGVVYDSLGLIILDENTSSTIESKLESRYGNLTDNQQVFSNLALLIESKIESADTTKEVELEITSEEIESALGASVMNIELHDAVEADLL